MIHSYNSCTLKWLIRSSVYKRKARLTAERIKGAEEMVPLSKELGKNSWDALQMQMRRDARQLTEKANLISLFMASSNLAKEPTQHQINANVQICLCEVLHISVFEELFSLINQSGPVCHPVRSNDKQVLIMTFCVSISRISSLSYQFCRHIFEWISLH